MISEHLASFYDFRGRCSCGVTNYTLAIDSIDHCSPALRPVPRLLFGILLLTANAGEADNLQVDHLQKKCIQSPGAKLGA
jgi:hypothetical protein